MTNQADIDDFLRHKRFAFVGVSRRAKDFSRELLRKFRDRGYDPVPVNPDAGEIDGRPCFARVQDVQPPADAVLLMTSSAVSGAVVPDCVAAGAKLIWFYRATGAGAVNDSALDYCREHGVRVIPGECPMMFLPGTGPIHRFHVWVWKIRGEYPK
jgi:predicted CoA-binding protein